MSDKLFAMNNLVAWCIVPFDAKKRGPKERVALLRKLGFTRYAYDWRAEHLPTFDSEVELLTQAKITLQAVWFPSSINDEAKKLLEVLKKHKVKTDLWVMLPNSRFSDSGQIVEDYANKLKPLLQVADEAGHTVSLYNHGGWAGEPLNQIALLKKLHHPKAGMVYNLHHGHSHFPKFSEYLKQMLPYLRCLNLNGMVLDGEAKGKKILPLGSGSEDLPLLHIIQNSGYSGPIGILGHTDDDVELRLQDNLDGLQYLLKRMNSLPASVPNWRTKF